jgi:iron-sulfur cluster assembly protein
VQGGGCSGLQYGMGFDNNILPTDTVIEVEGVKVIVDRVSIAYLVGATIDYVDSLMGGGFAISNPNAVSTCGCGNSFRTSGSDAGSGGCSGCG